MNTIKLSVIPLILLSISAAPTSAPSAADDLAREFEQRLQKSRYMESGNGREVEVGGWKGLPTKRFTYQVKDKDGTTKSADVILLDPSAKQIATWIVDALTEVKGHYDPADGRKVFQHIIAQSGGQFPVAGVVYEDILPDDGKNEIYCFRDGVTVEVEGVPHRGVAPLTTQQVEASISGKVKRVFTYGRIASTSPKMWIDAGGSPDVVAAEGKSSAKWLEAVRKAYQSAWNSPRNELIVAWVRANR